jgi:hypothetical protein
MQSAVWRGDNVPAVWGPYRDQTTPIVRSGRLLLFIDQFEHPRHPPSTTGSHMDIWGSNAAPSTCLCGPGAATGGKAIRTRSSVETGKKRGPQGRAAKQGRKRKAGVVIKGN